MLRLFRFIIVSLFFFVFAIHIYGQEKEKEMPIIKFICIEIGIDFLDSDIPNYDFIRGDISYLGSVSATDYLSGYFQKWYFGLKAEVRSKNNKFGLLGGIRYSSTNSSLGKNTYWESSSDYFFLLLNQEGTTTEFLKIKEVNNSADYIGIPLEIRYFPYKPRAFRLYFKVAAEFNYLLSDKSEVIFENNTMQNYEAEVLDKFDKPDNFYTAVYGAVGWNLNLKNKVYINFEVDVPSIFLADYSSGLIDPIAGGGFQLFVQIPF
ncbi:hypothetical protein ACFLS4_03890 [Bacteroidota bacterium]